MERNREGRRWSMASVNGIGIGMSKRRHRITSLRYSTEGERQVELQEMARLRDRRERVQKKDRDKNRDRQIKRRRLERYAPRNKGKDVDGGCGSGAGDSSAEESFDEDFEEYDGGKALLSNSEVNTITLASTVRSSPADEMIGVPVPRRARSASVKRSHEYWNSSIGGFGEVHSSRRFSPSPLSRSNNGVSTSYSSLPTRKRMKHMGPKTQIPKVSAEPSSSIQDDIEIEVVEALFDLMKQSQSLSQSQSSMKFERSSDNNSTSKFDSICNKAADDNSTCSPIISAKIVPQASDLQQEISFPSTPLLDVGSKNKEEEDGKDKEIVEVSAYNVSSTEIKPHSEKPIKMRSDSCLSKFEKSNIAPDACEHKGEGNVGRGKDPKDDQAGESVVGDELVIREQAVASKEEESRSCAKSNADASTNSSVSKANQRAGLVENKREAKFEIDLMAPLLIPSSPERERDGVTEIGSGHKFVPHDVQMQKSKTVAKDEFLVSGKGHEEKQMQTNCIKQEFTKLDFEKRHKDNSSISQHGQNQQRQCKVPLSEGQHFAQTNFIPFPIAVTGWPGGYHPGYMSPFQMITPTPLDGSAKPSAQLQPLPFSLSKPRPKRCATHQHIARSICYHQQLAKNYTWPAAFGPASINPTSSVSNSITGNSLQGDLLAGHVLASKSSVIQNNMDATTIKQPMLQQASQQTQPGNLVHGPAFIFPLGQHQARGEPTSQAGSSKSAKASAKVSLSNNSVERPAVSSLSSPSGTATISFNCSNLPVNEALPFVAILQNNGYPFSISTNGEIPPTIKGTEVPVLPLLNASYYSSIFHDSQVQQQQSTSQPQSNCLHIVQLPSQAASTASGSSSFHNGPHNQPQRGSQPSGHRSLSLAGMQQQQSQKQHASPSSSKLDKDMNRQDSPIAVDSRESCAKKSSHRKSLTVPVQPMNVALMSHGALYTAGGNQHQYPQQKGSKYGMEVTTPQAFALSFGSTTSSTPALNFSSVSQNPAVFQLLPDSAKCGYQLMHAAQVSQHKNFRVADGKSIVGAASNDDGTKGILGKSVAQSLNFSKLACSNPSTFTVNEIAAVGSTRVSNALPSAHTGNQPSTSSSTALTAVLSVDTPNCHPQHQQQELIQFSKQHIQQMQMTGAAQVRAPTTNIPHSFSGSNLPNSNGIASHNLVQNIHFAQLPSLKNTSLSTTSPIPSPANTSSLINLTQRQQRSSRHTQISFGSSSNSATAFQGQQIVINSKPASSLVDVLPSNSSLSKNILGSGSMEITSRGHKSESTMTALPSQQTENFLNGPSQKSSAVCGRNVPQYLAHAQANYLNSSTDDMIC